PTPTIAAVSRMVIAGDRTTVPAGAKTLFSAFGSSASGAEGPEEQARGVLRRARPIGRGHPGQPGVDEAPDDGVHGPGVLVGVADAGEDARARPLAEHLGEDRAVDHAELLVHLVEPGHGA